MGGSLKNITIWSVHTHRLAHMDPKTGKNSWKKSIFPEPIVLE
jgi:hypothetical protein